MRGGAFLLAIVLSSTAGNAAARAADPTGLSTATIHGVEGNRIRLAAPPGGASVVIFYSTECPISNSYSPTFKELVESFPAGKVKWVGICVDPDISDSVVKAHARDFSLKFPVAHDKHGVLARKLGTKFTPEAFLIDDAGKVRYHGRIDDQFAARQKRNVNPSSTDLKDALEALLSGKEIKTEFVEAIGCPMPEAPLAAVPTYSKDVASIIQKNCQECHRKGQVGPFALETYDQARKRSSDIAAVVDDRVMPPWKANPHVGPKFKDARTLLRAGYRHDRGLGRERRRKETRPRHLRRPSFRTTGSWARRTWFWTSGLITTCRPTARISTAASSRPPV